MMLMKPSSVELNDKDLDYTSIASYQAQTSAAGDVDPGYIS